MTMTSIASCRFCGIFSSDSVGLVDTPWLRDDHYCAIVSKGALVPGWSLICPLAHGLSLTNDYRSQEFWDFSGSAEALLRERYGDIRLFEHGTAFAGSPTGCGTDHAHLHMVPLSFSLATEALRYDSTLTWSSCNARDIKDRVAGKEYLFVSDNFDGNETSGLLCLLEAPISQFFRRVVASRIGLREFYDYRRHPMLEIADRTASDLRDDVLSRGQVDAR
jgi:diadenosine tetraphosphate (Ap4A) HIT family hydrolase